MPVYVLEIYDLKEKKSMVWQFLTESNFSTNKIDAWFCAIEVDHCTEHKNPVMKVISRIRGLTSNTEAFEDFI